MSVLFTYIIYPIIGILLIVFGYIIAKKNKLTSNKKLISYLLLCVVCLTIPALLGLLNYNFMPLGYLFLVFVYMLLGYYNKKILKWMYKDSPPFSVELSLLIFTQFAAGVLFGLVFNYCNELRIGFWVATSNIAFMFPSIYVKTNSLFAEIPVAVYKVWKSTLNEKNIEHEEVDYNHLKLVKIELFKTESDNKTTVINAKAPFELSFGAWFSRLLNDYNLKSPLSPIEDAEPKATSGWIFYTKPSVFLPRNYIDFERNFKQNMIRENQTIIAKRVKESKQEA